MQLPVPVQSLIETHLGTAISVDSRLHGGVVNEVYQLISAAGDFVVKVTRAQPQADWPRAFFAEAQGLALLRDAGMQVPNVIAYGDATGGYQYLLLSYLSSVAETPEQAEQLGRNLATLHQSTAEQFGGTAASFFGEVSQENPECEHLSDFLWEYRIKPLLEHTAACWSEAEMDYFHSLAERLPKLIPDEPPTLIHGDLWHGNIMYTTDGPALIDPAATYAHREMDLSMLQLFNDFPSRTFDAYNEAFPLAEGWFERMSLWNLAPLLLNQVLYGKGYKSNTLEALGLALRL